MELTAAHTKKLTFFNDVPAKILFFVFAANFFYDDPSLYLFKRVMYVVFITLATYELYKFYQLSKTQSDTIALPSYFKIYTPLVALFVCWMLLQDFLNPTLKFMTLFQNPYALLSVTPLFFFYLGAQAKNEKAVYNVLITVSVVFLALFLLPFAAGKIKFYQGYVSSIVVIPIIIFSLRLKKNLIYPIVLIGFSAYFSNVSEYRIVSFRILMFGAFFVSLNLFRPFGLVKLIIIATASFLLYHFILNLDKFLLVFKQVTEMRRFDDDDTRAFLWEELFDDLSEKQVWLGKGFLGTYFSPYFFDRLVKFGDYADYFDRYIIEVGFLQLVMKGGVIYYFLYIWSPLYATIKGLFSRFKDPFVHNLAIFVLTELLLMFIENIPYYSFQFCLIFFFSGMIYRGITLNKMEEEAEELEEVEPANLSYA